MGAFCVPAGTQSTVLVFVCAERSRLHQRARFHFEIVFVFMYTYVEYEKAHVGESGHISKPGTRTYRGVPPVDL